MSSLNSYLAVYSKLIYGELTPYCAGAPNLAKFRGGCRGPVKIRQRGGGGCNFFFTSTR